MTLVRPPHCIKSWFIQITYHGGWCIQEGQEVRESIFYQAHVPQSFLGLERISQQSGVTWLYHRSSGASGSLTLASSPPFPLPLDRLRLLPHFAVCIFHETSWYTFGLSNRCTARWEVKCGVSGLRQNSSRGAAPRMLKSWLLPETPEARASQPPYLFQKIIGSLSCFWSTDLSAWPQKCPLRWPRESFVKLCQNLRGASRCACGKWGPEPPLSTPEMLCDKKGWRSRGIEYWSLFVESLGWMIWKDLESTSIHFSTFPLNAS